MQEAGTSRSGGGWNVAIGDTNVPNPRTGSGARRPPNPQPRTTRTSQLIALKEGDPIPEGYALVVESRGEPVASSRTHQRSPCETVDLSTPPKAPEPHTEEGPDTARSKTAARRNLTRSTNRKANATFAKDLKESLATGEPTTNRVGEDEGVLKGKWHAAAKELAYKFLDLTKESWKDYNIFEKTTIHNELKEQFKFYPPICPKLIDKYLSGHLRTSRAVWKAHWKKHGPSKRHHNCPQDAWDKLCLWWPTTKCQEEAAEMASRRAMVERTSKVGRSSLVDRMGEQVSSFADTNAVYLFACEYCFGNVCSEFMRMAVGFTSGRGFMTATCTL